MRHRGERRHSVCPFSLCFFKRAAGACPAAPAFFRNGSRKSAHTKPLFIVHENAKKNQTRGRFFTEKTHFSVFARQKRLATQKSEAARKGGLTWRLP
jgi:hypothetical protein